MTIKWVTPVGSLGTITERFITEIPLLATSDIGSVEYSLIAGNLPRGLRLDNGVIKGSPVEVKRFTISRFVVRADDGTDIEDRTFSISVDGADAPQWITREGFLNVGQGENYFVLDNAYVDFQLEVTDSDLTANDSLEFYLSPMGGQLPPGLSLSRDGRITGFTDPVFAIDNIDPNGAYDTAGFDIAPLDVYQARSNGYDTFFYDLFTFDYSEPNITPRRLSRFYTFVVTVTDGLHDVKRLFRIWVVTEEFLKSDNSIVQVDTNLFRADNDAFRKPEWITASNLGKFRANNYVTIYLDVFDPPSLEGTIAYFLLSTNPGSYQLLNTDQIVSSRYEITGDSPVFDYTLIGPWNAQRNYKTSEAVTLLAITPAYTATETWVCLRDNVGITPSEGTFWTKQLVNTNLQTFKVTDNTLWKTVVPETASTIPKGLVLDPITGELAGVVPYQPAITKSFQFTMQAVSFPITLKDIQYTLMGDWNSTTTYKVNQAVRYRGFIYIALYENKGVIPSEPTGNWELGVATSEKTFTVEIIGEIESSITWISDNNVGSIKPNQASQLFVEATTTNYGGKVVYELVSGQLPPGLELIATGNIQGKVRQFGDSTDDGLTRFYDLVSNTDDSTGSREYNTTFDGGETTFDRRFVFNIKARDTANFAESIKQFYIDVNSDTTKTFANLYVKAFQSKQKRLDWYNFITDLTIFKSSEIYRYGDPNFGVQTELKVLVFAGIESVQAVRYVQAMSRNHYRKQLRFGDVKKAVAKDPVTQETIYEVIYVDVVDEYEKDGKSISKTIQLSDSIESKVLISYDSIRVDSNIPFVSDADHQRVFPNSFKNMRLNIKEIGTNDREFLPIWMRSIQPGTPVETGYVKSLVLCYTKPGLADTVMSKIKFSNFDFKSIDFTADRYLIDILEGEIEDKYLAFPQRGEKLP